MKSKIKGCTHHSSKVVVRKFRNGGEVGGIGGGSGVNGSGNSGNGGYSGGSRGGAGNGSPGTGGSMDNRPAMTSPSVAMPAAKPAMTIKKPPVTAAVRPAIKPPVAKPAIKPAVAKPKPQVSVSAIGGSGAQAYKGGPADRPVNRQEYKNNVVGGMGVPGYGGSNYGGRR